MHTHATWSYYTLLRRAWDHSLKGIENPQLNSTGNNQFINESFDVCKHKKNDRSTSNK